MVCHLAFVKGSLCLGVYSVLVSRTPTADLCHAVGLAGFAWMASLKWSGQFEDFCSDFKRDTCFPQRWSIRSVHFPVRSGRGSSGSHSAAAHCSQIFAWGNCLKLAYVWNHRDLVGELPRDSEVQISFHVALCPCSGARLGEGLVGKGPVEKNEACQLQPLVPVSVCAGHGTHPEGLRTVLSSSVSSSCSLLGFH